MNKSVDKYNNTYHHFKSKETFDANYSALTQKIESIHKASKSKLVITKYEITFSKAYTKNWSKEIFRIESVLKTNPWTYNIIDLNGEKIIEDVFMKKNCY